MNRKAKGTAGERELLHKFWEKGWACLRSAGSGSMKHPSPDIIAGTPIRKVAIECKVVKGTTKYFNKYEIEQLKLFSTAFGTESYVAIKYKNKDWYFISLEDMKQTPEGYSVTEELAKQKGLIFDELIGIFN